MKAESVDPEASPVTSARTERTETAKPGDFEPLRIEMLSGFEDIVPGYLEARKVEAREMIELLSASNFARLAHIGHQLRGNGGAYGFPELTRLGAALENSAKGMDRSSLETHLNELKVYLDRVELVARL